MFIYDFLCAKCYVINILLDRIKLNQIKSKVQNYTTSNSVYHVNDLVLKLFTRWPTVKPAWPVWQPWCHLSPATETNT